MSGAGSYRPPAPLGLSSKQLEQRRTVIGGTDAAAIVGVSRRKTRHDVYIEKVGLSVPTDAAFPEAAMWGLLLEPVIRWRYSEREGVAVRVPRGLHRHVRYRWLAGHLDGITDRRVVEVKTARRAEGWGPDGSDELPLDYRCQVMHYLAVTDLPFADVAVLIGGQDFRVITVERDEQAIRDLVAEEAEFRVDHILARVPPEPDGSDGAYALARALYPEPDGMDKVALPGATWDAIDELLRASATESAAAKEAARLKQVLMMAMGTATRLIGHPDASMTWGDQRGRVDYKAYSAHLAERLKALGVNDDDLDVERFRAESSRTFRVQTTGGSNGTGN